MSDSDLLRGPITDKHLETSEPAISAATKKKPGTKHPVRTCPTLMTCQPKPPKKTPAKKAPAKKK